MYRPSDAISNDGSLRVLPLASGFASGSRNVTASEMHVRPPLLLVKASSASRLPMRSQMTERGPRRSRSDSWLRPLLKSTTATSTQESSWSDGTNGADSTASKNVIPTLHVQEPTNENLLMADLSGNTLEQTRPLPPEQNIRLHKMGISQQLRCMSQLSDAVEDNIYRHDPDPWTFHHRERSDILENSRNGRRPRHISSSGIDSTNVPSAWGRVRSPVPDAASSIYSRPTSAGASGDRCETDTPDARPDVPDVDLHALFSDWPLKPPQEGHRAINSDKDALVRPNGSGRRNKPLPSTPTDSRKDSGTASFVTATNGVEDAEPPSPSPSPSPPQPPQSTLRSSNASIFTKASRSSKLTERAPPPKKVVRKRRSIFKFLRPSSRRNWDKPPSTRSISSPGLLPRTPNSYDGQVEDPALLTVQYELDEQPVPSRRVASMNNLLTAPGAEMSTPLPVLQRRPTLADYERNLSVIGDDRRRPSDINIQRAQEIQEDDHRDSVGMRRRISRARPLKDDASPLMAQALEKHQQEKALFRSASKARESLKSSMQTAPVFRSSPFSSPPFSSLAPTLDHRSDTFLDPLDKSPADRAIQRSRSSTYLLPPDAPPPKGSSAPSSQAVSLRSNIAPIPVAKKRIGTALESWSRYPSHSRAERCGSAGRPDNVITRDFAVDVDHANIHETEDVEPTTTPRSKGTQKSKRYKPPPPKSLSTTFSDLKRYYSNIFSSSVVGQNRRTSITPGGRLEYPELELLPPQWAAEPSPKSSHKHPGAFNRLKEDAEKLRDFVKAEEGKVQEFVKEEEEELETFVKQEEDAFEGFVRKEEGKIKHFIEAEEDKFMHHWHHQHSEHSSQGRNSPFREISLFEGPRDHEKTRRDTDPIGPTDSVESNHEGTASESSANGGLRFDGESASISVGERKSSSKAELWSEVYRECLTQTPSTVQISAKNSKTITNSVPPPQLKPVKPRSPEHRKEIESTATIRRFPSVTVIDDRKGHFRSISLISVKTSRSTGLQCTGTQETLKMVSMHEHEEECNIVEGHEDAIPAKRRVEERVGSYM